MAKSQLYEIRDGSKTPSSFVVADTLSLVGSGGGADVFRISGPNDIALKIYRTPSQTDWPKIEYQVGHPVFRKTRPTTSQTYFAWPTGTILLDGEKVGITLPYVDRTKWISLDTWTEPRLLKKLSAENASLGRKLVILRNLAKRIAQLHARYIYVIDLRPSNILIHCDTGEVCLIDCDSFRIEAKNGPIFPGSHVSAGYISPEAVSGTLEITSLKIEQDLYALGVIAFQILNYGIHPFQGILTDKTIDAGTNDEKARLGLYAYGLQPSAWIAPLSQSVHNSWPVPLRKMFAVSFDTKSVRPSARQWHSAFNKILSQKMLERCPKHPADPRHIRFESLPCLACCRHDAVSEIRAKAPASKPTTKTSPRPSAPSNVPPQSSSGWPKWILAGVFLLILWAIINWIPANKNSNTGTEQPVTAQSDTPAQEPTPQTSTQSENGNSGSSGSTLPETKPFFYRPSPTSPVPSQVDRSAPRGDTSPSNTNADSQSLEKALARAQAGDGEAAYEVGSMYEHGEGVPQSYDDAIQWYRKAEALGYISARGALIRLTSK